jgi:hypothetical protein
MNMSQLQLGAAFRLMMKTMPILLVRLGATLAFWLVAILYFAVVGWVAWLVGQAVPLLGIILFIIAFIGVGVLYRLAYRYVFYMIKAAHIAVISELLVRGELPSGESQLNWGKKRVVERFGEMNVMFVVDELVTAVIRAFTRTVYNIARILPGDTIRTLARILNRVIENATSYIDEAVLARSFYEERESVWTNARDGVVLYAMIWKPILTNAVALMVLSYVPFLVVFILFSAPVGFLISLFSQQLAGWAIIFTLVLAYLVKVAVGDAFAMTAIISAYHRETQGLTPDPQMASRLDSVSDKFQQLRDRAETSLGGQQDVPPVAPDTPDTPEAPPAPGTPPPPSGG